MSGLLEQSHNTKRSNIQYNKFHGNNKFLKTLNPTFFHHLLIVVLIGQDINLDIFYDENTLNKNKQCKQVAINLKAQAILYTLLLMLFSNARYK